MTIAEIASLIESDQKTTEEKIFTLKRIRAKLMEGLHREQQLVDQVDYMIYELKAEQKKRE